MKCGTAIVAPTGADAERRGLLGKVHVARRALGIAEDDYRARVERITGHRSAGDCDGRQLRAVVAELERLGFKPAGRSTPAARLASSAWARKARATWIGLHQLGAINDPAEAKLERFAARQLGVDRMAWANDRDGYRVVEALKAMAARHGWDVRVPSSLTLSADRTRFLRSGLIAAQLAKLAAAAVAGGATGRIAADRASWSIADLDRAAAELGARIRSLPG